MTYDFTRHMDEIATWYHSVLSDLYPAGPDRDAKRLLLAHHQEFATLAANDPSPTIGAAAVQWARAIVVLADAERDLGRPGWQPEWTEVYEYYVSGNDPVLGPSAPQGPSE
ncbi:hypothetical protein ACFW89_35390, partial [Streptomyces albidoflavus]